MLLVSGGNLLIEVAEALVFVGLYEGKGAGELAGDGDLAGGGNGFGGKRSVAWPGDLGTLRGSLDGEAGRQMKDDLVGDLVGKVHVYRLKAFFLIDEWVAPARFKKEAGEENAFGCGCSDGPFKFDDSNQIDVGIVEAEEVIEVSLGTIGAEFCKPLIEFLFDFVEIVLQRDLPPPEGLLSAHDE